MRTSEWSGVAMYNSDVATDKLRRALRAIRDYQPGIHLNMISIDDLRNVQEIARRALNETADA